MKLIIDNDELETIVVCPLTSKLDTQWRSRLQIQYANKKAEIAVDQNNCGQFRLCKPDGGVLWPPGKTREQTDTRDVK